MTERFVALAVFADDVIDRVGHIEGYIFDDNGAEPDGNAWLYPAEELSYESLTLASEAVEGYEVGYYIDEDGNAYTILNGYRVELPRGNPETHPRWTGFQARYVCYVTFE